MKYKNFSIYMYIFMITALVFAGNFAYAASFNTASQDSPMFEISNYTRNPGCNTCWSTSVSADAGQVASFTVFYHNTSSETANQTRVYVDLPQGTFTSQSIFGRVSATNAPASSGSVFLTLTSSQTLTFIPGSVFWYPTMGGSAQALPSGQSGVEAINGTGLLLGDIAPGAQGNVVIRAQVGNQSTTPPTNGPQGSAPSVSTQSASGIAGNFAVLNGSVTPNNSLTSVWFEWGTSSNLGSTLPIQNVGSGTGALSFSTSLQNLQPNTTYYFRAVGQNGFGTNYGSIINFTTQTSQTTSQGSAPSVNTLQQSTISQNVVLLNGSVNPNNTYTTAWFDWGATPSLGNTVGSQGLGSGANTISYTTSLQNLQPNTIYYYRAVGQNAFGTSYGSIFNFTTSGALSQSGAAVVNTLAASSIFQNAALLNGSVNPNNDATSAWFEWGTNASFGNNTTIQPMGSGSNTSQFSYALSGLTVNTTYYYRAAARNSYGTYYGNTLSFTTRTVTPPVAATPPSVIIQRTETPVAQSPLISLIPSTDKNEPAPQDEITYTILVKNDSTEMITDAILTIRLPVEAEFVSANIAPATKDVNTLAFRLGGIGAKTEVALNIKAKVRPSTVNGAALIFGATLDYTDALKRFQTTNAYLTITVRGVAATAAIFGGFGLPFWLIILILMFVAIYFGYRGYALKKQEQESVPIKI